jgi:hypothetical protein
VDAYNTPRVLEFYRRADFDFIGDKDKDRPTRIMFYDLKRLPEDAIGAMLAGIQLI